MSDMQNICGEYFTYVNIQIACSLSIADRMLFALINVMVALMSQCNLFPPMYFLITLE